jgi:hypothetical protein
MDALVVVFAGAAIAKSPVSVVDVATAAASPPPKNLRRVSFI